MAASRSPIARAQSSPVAPSGSSSSVPSGRWTFTPSGYPTRTPQPRTCGVLGHHKCGVVVSYLDQGERGHRVERGDALLDLVAREALHALGAELLDRKSTV